jgi:hypothetical protein
MQEMFLRDGLEFEQAFIDRAEFAHRKVAEIDANEPPVLVVARQLIEQRREYLVRKPRSLGQGARSLAKRPPL